MLHRFSCIDACLLIQPLWQPVRLFMLIIRDLQSWCKVLAPLFRLILLILHAHNVIILQNNLFLCHFLVFRCIGFYFNKPYKSIS